MKLRVKEDPRSVGIDIVVFFLKAWIVMLAAGALGHQLGDHGLTRITYGDALLILFVTLPFRNTGTTRLIVEDYK